MVKCSNCKTQNVPPSASLCTCKLCGITFCWRCRLPEIHNCANFKSPIKS